jgi:hypothetical protein
MVIPLFTFLLSRFRGGGGGLNWFLNLRNAFATVSAAMGGVSLGVGVVSFLFSKFGGSACFLIWFCILSVSFAATTGGWTIFRGVWKESLGLYRFLRDRRHSRTLFVVGRHVGFSCS